MANTYSSNLRLIIQSNGSNSGTWGTYTNTNIGTLLEQAITGIGAIAVSGSSDHTLTSTDGASDEARNAILNVTGTLTAAINIICPTVSKTYIIKNGTTGGYAITLKTSGGTGISVPNGFTMFLYCDGTNVVEAVNYQTTGKFSSVTDTGLTSGRVTYAGTGGLLQDSSALTFDGTTLTSTKFAGALNGTVGATTPSTGAFTTLSASSTVSGTGFSTYLASPPAIGGTAAAAGSFTTLSASSTVSGTGFSTYLASPPAIGGTTAAAITGTTITATTGLSGPHNGTVGATTPAGGRFTTLSASSYMYVGPTQYSGVPFTNSTNLTDSIAYSNYTTSVIQSTVTNGAHGYYSNLSTAAASFTLTNLYHFKADKGSFGAGSTVTNQYGYCADSSLVGATNNYGFYGNIPGATNYNLYMAGSAPNYLAGSLNIGANAYVGYNFQNAKLLSGASSCFANMTTGLIQSDVTNAYGYYSNLSTAAASFTLTNLYHFGAGRNSFGPGSTVTNQYGFLADSTITGATNNYGFYGNVASGSNSYNLYMNGTADNWFSGNVRIGGAGGLGYTTGSGGAVTQATSRTTGVTLNKTNGAITLVSAAGSASYQSFTVTNSTVVATDTIIINQKSGTDLYEVFITAVAAGSFRVTFATTGGTTTEQPVFNFAVIKAVTA